MTQQALVRVGARDLSRKVPPTDVAIAADGPAEPPFSAIRKSMMPNRRGTKSARQIETVKQPALTLSGPRPEDAEHRARGDSERGLIRIAPTSASSMMMTIGRVPLAAAAASQPQIALAR